jgi:hypothetical protein
MLRITLVLALCVGVMATTGATASAASGVSRTTLIKDVHHPQGHIPARAAGIEVFLRKLFSHVVHKARPIVTKKVTKRVIRKFAWEWTKEQAVDWYCDRWYAAFGYDRSYWYWAANNYYHPFWAWRTCARWGYFS